MASARTLSTNELGTIRYCKAAASGKWPIEVRLLPQQSDTARTTYTLHTPGNPTIPFSHTRREELRATLAVAPGPLVYEVLRDGVLVSTGGLEVRPADPISAAANADDATAAPSPFGVRLAARPPSGAQQMGAHDACDSLVRADGARVWRVTFRYNELTWMAREVSVVDAHTGRGVASLTRGDAGFVGACDFAAGVFEYRFRVVPYEALHAHVAAPTRLGWDDGAMTHSWELMTWPLSIEVRDLSKAGVKPADALFQLGKPGPGNASGDTDGVEDMGRDGDSKYRAEEGHEEEEEEEEEEDIGDDDADADANSETAASLSVDKPFAKRDLDEATNWQRNKLAYVHDSNDGTFAHHHAGGKEDSTCDASTTCSVKVGDMATAEREPPGMRFFGMNMLMFALGSTVTIMLGKLVRRRDDDDDDDVGDGDGSDGGSLFSAEARRRQSRDASRMKHQRGLPF